MPVFEDTITVAAHREEVWRFLMDVERLGACMPGCEDTQWVSHDTIKARVRVKIGPYSTTQAMTIHMTELDPPHHLTSQGEGDDRRMGSKVKVKATLDLVSTGGSETQVKYRIEVTVLGRLGTVGEPIMRAKARQMSREFGANLKSAIEGSH